MAPHACDAPATNDAAVPLPSHLSSGSLAWRCVCAVGRALSPGRMIAPDPAQVAAAYRSHRHLRIDGLRPEVWSPLSRFWPTSDGWVRTHGNYPHHAAALRTGLRLPADAEADEVGSRLAVVEGEAAAHAIVDAGGLCVTVRHESAAVDAALRRSPLVSTTGLLASRARPLADDDRSPLRGVRVLDLTRVIAGPVATRTLAFAGADVLRIDPPHLPELVWQHLDSGHGKRSALLDITADPARFEALVADADVIVLGYRPAALRRLGLSPARLAARNPQVIVAQLSAWPGTHSRRGFDSMVQAESGISWAEAEAGATSTSPGALPAQVLDHSAGYLLAAGVIGALQRRAQHGGSWLVRTSLRRVAADLLGMPRSSTRAQARDEHARTQQFEVAGREVTTVAPAVRWPSCPDGFPPPRPWGGDRAEW